MANIGYATGSTCLCTCCSGIGCTATLVGNVTVSSCSSCGSSLCQSSYSSTCVSVNGQTSSSCVNSSSGADTLFDSIYRTLAMVIVSLSLLMYQKIKI